MYNCIAICQPRPAPSAEVTPAPTTKMRPYGFLEPFLAERSRCIRDGGHDPASLPRAENFLTGRQPASFLFSEYWVQGSPLPRAWGAHPTFNPRTSSRPDPRSEERRVGKECRSRWSPYH